MLAKLGLVFVNNRNVIRIASYLLLSFVLLSVTWMIDLGFPALKSYVPDQLLLSVETSTSFLLNLSGVFLTVTTFTFTTILTILNHHSDAFTPRIVQDFVEKKNVLSLFGIFVGGFFYTVLALFFLQNEPPEYMVISGTVGVAYAATSMVAFILFVRRVLIDIKVDNVVEDVAQKALALAEREAERRTASEAIIRRSAVGGSHGIRVYVQSTGYLYGIDETCMTDALGDLPADLVITRKIGEYVPRGMYVATLFLGEGADLSDAEIAELSGKISHGFIINTAKNEERDYHFEMTNLVEIALKALSPGINDPNTAILCIDKLSLIMGRLFSTTNRHVLLAYDEGTRVIYNSYSVSDDLYHAFSQILYYAKDEPAVGRAVLKSIYVISMIAEPSVRREIDEFAQYVYRTCREALESELDVAHLDVIKEDFYDRRELQSDDRAMRE